MENIFRMFFGTIGILMILVIEFFAIKCVFKTLIYKIIFEKKRKEINQSYQIIDDVFIRIKMINKFQIITKDRLIKWIAECIIAKKEQKINKKPLEIFYNRGSGVTTFIKWLNNNSYGIYFKENEECHIETPYHDNTILTFGTTINVNDNNSLLCHNSFIEDSQFIAIEAFYFLDEKKNSDEFLQAISKVLLSEKYHLHK